MFFPIDDATRKQAKSPHELAMVNLIVFNLLIAVALLAGSMAQPDSGIARYKWLAVAAPLAVSLALMAFARLKAARVTDRHWFVAAHWRLSARRYRLLLIAYAVCAGILCVPLISAEDPDRVESKIHALSPAMQEMERRKLESQDMAGAVWARIGVVPLLLAVMTSIMLESGSIYQASRGEVPDELIRSFPPPLDLQGSEEPR